ncbi:MAG: methionyl-tRNA formyltransferase [Planctomycetaceae bacterium]
MTLRVAFLGNDPWSVPPLEAIAGEPDLHVDVVVTNAAKPAGRGSALRSTAVAEVARALGLPLVEAAGVREGAGHDALRRTHPDVIVVVAYGELLSRDVLELAPHGALNLHFSLLPRWRGAAPVQHAILAGDDRTGVTVMRMDEGLDTGPILNQLEEDVRPEDDAGSLGLRLARLGGMVLVGVLRRLGDELLPARAQDEAAATWAPRLGPADRALPWTDEPEAIVRRVRSLAPEPGAAATFRGEPLKVFAAAVAHDEVPSQAGAGELVTADDRGVLVRAGRGGVRLLEVGPAGRKRMAAAAWARGARFAPGERLG